MVLNPLMSVVIVVGSQRQRAERCLQSILEQNLIDHLEVLVMDCAAPDTPPLVGTDHPIVRVFRLSPQTLDSQAHAQAMRLARAEIVAFIEEHCIAFPGWAEALVKAHGGPWAGVGGEVRSDNRGAGVSDAEALLNYGFWMPPAIAGESQLLPSRNSSYKREVLLNYGDRLEVLLRCETVLQRMLRKEGYRLFVAPDAKIAHIDDTTLASMVKGYYLFHRCLAATRAQVFNWSKAKRVTWVALIPLYPFVRIFLLFVFLVRRHPRLLALFFRGLPAILAAQFYAAWGQAMGLILGMGDAELLFSIFARDEQRVTEKDGSGED